MIKQSIKSVLVWLLTAEAKAVLRKYKPKIIAVTGSVGKTATKDASFVVVSALARTRKSQKSFNSEFGVPLTILGIEESGWYNPFAWISYLLRGLELVLFATPYPEWLVLEVGVDHPGDMKRITAWLRPDIAVFTRMGDVPVHIEFFKDRVAVVEEKSALIEALRPGGVAILNADDPDVFAASAKTHERILTFGAGEAANLRISGAEIRYSDKGMPWGLSLEIAYGDEIVPVTILGTIALHYAYPLAAALAVGTVLGGDLTSSAQALRSFEVPPGRGKLIDGMNGSLIIDDTYNASPTAVEASLLALKVVEIPGQKIAVLGDMLELGKWSPDEHRRIGSLAAGSADHLISIGVRAHEIVKEAVRQGMPEDSVQAFANRDDAAEYVASIINRGDVLLVKGSQGMRLEKLVKRIMARPEDASKLLVRQEPQWLKR